MPRLEAVIREHDDEVVRPEALEERADHRIGPRVVALEGAPAGRALGLGGPEVLGIALGRLDHAPQKVGDAIDPGEEDEHHVRTLLGLDRQREPEHRGVVVEGAGEPLARPGAEGDGVDVGEGIFERDRRRIVGEQLVEPRLPACRMGERAHRCVRGVGELLALLDLAGLDVVGDHDPIDRLRWEGVPPVDDRDLEAGVGDDVPERVGLAVVAEVEA